MSDARTQFLCFAGVGAAGFVVDASVLHLSIVQGGADPYTGRVISFLIAASFTWALNRRYTFRAHRSDRRLHEWGRFVTGNSVGGLLNYFTYALLVASTATVSRYPVIGVAVGSAVGLLVNFSLSRRFVFGAHREGQELRVDGTLLLMALLTVAAALTLIVNPWPRDRWYITQYLLFGSFPGYDNYTPVAVPALIYFVAHSIATRMGLDLAGEFYVAALIQDAMLFLSACFLYWAMKRMQMTRLAAPVAVGFLLILLSIGIPHTFYSENAAVFLMCALLLILAAIPQGSNEASRRFWMLSVLCGVIIGLLVATRMTPILLIPLIPLLFWRRLPVRRIAAVVGVTVVMTSVLLTGLAVSNHARFGRYELTNSSGRHLWQGVKDFTDRALGDSSEYRALKRMHPKVQGTYWDKLPPYGRYNEVVDPREEPLGRLAKQAILNSPELYLFHGAKKFVRTIGIAPSPDVFAGPGDAWNPLERKEPLTALLNVVHAPPAFSAAGEAFLRATHAAFTAVYPISIFVVALTGLAMVVEHLGRLLRRRSARSPRLTRGLPLAIFVTVGVPLACIPLAVFGRTGLGYVESGLCALALGYAANTLAESLGNRVEPATVQEDRNLFFFSAFAFFGTLWFTWQIEYQAPRYAIPYLPFWAVMLAVAVLYWKRLWVFGLQWRLRTGEADGGISSGSMVSAPRERFEVSSSLSSPGSPASSELSRSRRSCTATKPRSTVVRNA